jgi:ribose transport system substrate-binding protein
VRRAAGLGKSLGFAQDNKREFIEGVGLGLAMSARDRGLAYERWGAENDPATQTADVEHFIAQKFGAVVTAPVDPQGLAPT